MYLYKAFLIITLLMKFNFSLFGDTIHELKPVRYNYTVENGLNSNFITDLFNDANGLLWIGTQNGMNIFDGRQFKSVDFSYVSESFVIKTTQAPNGTIWFSTLDGLLYYVTRYVAYPHQLNDSIKALKNRIGVPMNLTVDSNSTIYSSGSNLVIEVSLDEVKVLDENSSKNGVKDSTKFEIYNTVLMGVSNEGSTFKSNRIQSIYFFNDTLIVPFISSSEKVSRQYSGNTLNSFAISRAKELIVYMNNKLKITSLDVYCSNSLYFESDTVLWVGTQGKGVLRVENHKITKTLLPNERVHAFLKDFEGGYWVGSEKGLDYYPNLSTTPYYVRSVKDQFLSIGSYRNQLVGVIKPAFLFRGKFFIEQKLENQFRYVKIVSNSNSEESRLYREHSLDRRPAVDLIDWKTLTSTPLDEKNNIMFIHRSDSFSYTHSDLGFYHDGEIQSILNEGKQIGRVRQISPIANHLHQYYVTSKNGLLSIHKNYQKGTLVVSSIIKSDRPLKHLFYLGNHILVTSDDDFIHLVNFKNRKLERISSIPREDTRSFFQLNSFEVLLGTASGLKLLTVVDTNNINSIRTRDITNEQGLAPLQVNQIEVINDTIYTLSESGIVCYPLSLLKQQPSTKGKITIDQFLVNGVESALNGKIYNDQTIAFNITAVSFKDRDHYLPSFNLLPLSEIAQPLYNNQLSFYNLPANNYTLQIQDQYGQLVQYSFSVNDYFYEKWWFLLLLILFLSTLLFIPIYIKNKYRAAEIRLEAEKDNWRLRTLTSQLKPHFIFNALSSIQAYILKNDARSSSEFLSKFSMYIRNALEQSRADTFPLNKALSAAKTYLELEQMRLNGDFEFEINTNGIATELYFIPVMLLQPYIENAVIHGVSSIDYHGKINIDISKKGQNEIYIRICDNGKGLKNSSHQGQGIGTSVNEERIKLMNSKKQNRFEVVIQDNIDGKGVCVLIKIQFKDGKD